MMDKNIKAVGALFIVITPSHSIVILILFFFVALLRIKSYNKLIITEEMIEAEGGDESIFV